MKKHTITCRNNNHKVKVFIIEDARKNGFWWSIARSHWVTFTCGRPFGSGKQLNNVPTDDFFTYYGNGDAERPDNVADMETLQWLIRDK